MNDYQGVEISERTFHRIRRLLEDAFQVTIELSKDGNQRYRLADDDQTPGRPTLVDLVLLRANENPDNTSSLNQIVMLLTSGRKLTDEDESALGDLKTQLNRIPYEYGRRLICDVESDVIKHADQAEWDWDYRNYVMLWDEATYQLTHQWLAVGICPDGIYFYIVSDEQDPDLRGKRAVEAGAAEGMRYRRGNWWHEMKAPQLFRMSFGTLPDYDEIVSRSEKILSSLKKIE